ncbi:hypothetical protein NX059_010773 [Plenodomus lindquistii]|nr:hypothetical protein NX059_010773 [Plenodomus lindquistii]
MPLRRRWSCAGCKRTVWHAHCSLGIILTDISISRRLMLHAWENLQADDWVMTLLLGPFTAAIVLANQISGDQSVDDRKLRFQLEVLQIVIIWLVKACLLVLYWRIL